MEKKVSLFKMISFTVCGIVVLDTFVAPAAMGVSSITVWLLTAILFFVPYGLINAELGAAYPDDGGIYAWAKRAFGDFQASLVAWFYWVNVAFWMPAVFIAFTTWFTMACAPEISLWWQALISIAMCWLVVFIRINIASSRSYRNLLVHLIRATSSKSIVNAHSLGIIVFKSHSHRTLRGTSLCSHRSFQLRSKISTQTISCCVSVFIIDSSTTATDRKAAKSAPVIFFVSRKNIRNR